MNYGMNALMALHTIERLPTIGIPTGLAHIMEHGLIERLADVAAGSYINDPYRVYIRMLKNIGVCIVDQFIPENPLTMGDRGYESGHARNAATTGGFAVLDGIPIKDAEDAARHMESYYIPRLEESIRSFSESDRIQGIINSESAAQAMLGCDILKAPYGYASFPSLLYGAYGYEPYFTAYMHYPEIVEKTFSLQADYSVLLNGALVKAINRAGLPRYMRLDHDMADSRGTLCSPASLERLWTPHFYRSIKPLADADFTLLWHCDGNLMSLVPFLLESGVNGFQGFQYEDGMNYVDICKMKPKRGGELVVMAGVSVTRTLPFGTPDDVAKEMRFLVENGTRHLILAMSSSCVPGTPYKNIKACVDGFNYYRLNGRN